MGDCPACRSRCGMVGEEGSDEVCEGMMDETFCEGSGMLPSFFCAHTGFSLFSSSVNLRRENGE
jgi:hypothetical protein